MKASSIQKMSASAMLIAIGIIIPLFSPVKIIMEPASFTLASHVAIFIAVMISPSVAAAVSIGTTIGFFFGAFPVVVVMRAATHIVFALCGALYLQRFPQVLSSPLKLREFSFVIGIVHAACEVLVVCPFYFSGGLVGQYYDKGFLQSVIILIGAGSVIHSMVDFELAYVVYRALGKQRGFIALSNK